MQGCSNKISQASIGTKSQNFFLAFEKLLFDLLLDYYIFIFKNSKKFIKFRMRIDS